MAWNYARYVGRVAEAGKAEYPIPMFVNAALYGIGQADPNPRHRAAAAPGTDVMDVWRAGAPRIDMLSPDTYSDDFVAFCAKYTQSGNPLFIPETGGGPEARPERSTPSDATTPSASRRSASTGRRVKIPIWPASTISSRNWRP